MEQSTMIARMTELYNSTKSWKSGARNSQADLAVIQEIHDLSGELGAKHANGDCTKAVEHPAAQKVLIQTMHDHSQTLGADCPGSTKIAAREDVNPKAGKNKYGSVTFADPTNSKYPIETEAHIRAAWNYINKSKNGGKYSSDDLAKIKSRIVAAWKKKIDPDGPPSAAPAKSESIQDLVDDLRQAWYAWWQEEDGPDMSQAQTTYPEAADEENYFCPMVIDVLDDAVVVKIKGKEWKVPYTINGVDDYSFSQPDEWVQVEESWEEVKTAGMQRLLESEVVINMGGAVKTDENGMFGGYLVPFTDPQHTDSTATKDYFDKATDFTPYKRGMRMPIWFNHTLAMKSAKDKIYQVKEQIGEGEVDEDENGIFFKDVIIFQNFRYRKALEMAVKSSTPERPLVGWSSGTAPHLMQREKVGNVNHITRWPLGLDASITPTPAGYKLGVGVTSIKTGFQFETELDLGEAEDPAKVAAAGVDPHTDQHSKSSQGTSIMTKEEQQALAAETAKLLLQMQRDEAEAVKTAQAKEKADQEAFEARVAEAIKKATSPVNRAALKVTKADTTAPAINKLPLGEDGEGLHAFNHWLKTGDNGGLRADSEHYAAFPDLVNPDAIKAAFDRGGAGMKTDYNIFGDTQYQGAELVPTLVYNKVIELRDKRSIARLSGAQVLPVGSKVMNVPIEKDRSGRFVIQASGTPTEGGTFDPNAVQILDKKALTMYDFTRTIEMSRQVLDDSVVQLEAWWNRHLARMEAVTENYFFVVGTGTLMPLGALYGGANGKTLASASTITAAEVIQLWHNMKQQYRNSVSFIATAATMGIIRALAANYAFSFIPTPSGSLQDTFVAGLDWIISPGTHVYESDDMPEFGNGTKPIVIGNFEEYLIGERQALSVFRDPYSRAKYGDVCFHCLFRRGGSTVTNEAFKYATCVST